MSILALKATSGKTFQISQRRVSKVVAGVQQDNVKLATKLGFIDGITDWYRGGIKKKHLSELFTILKESVVMNKVEINHDFPNLKAICVCIAINQMLESAQTADSIDSTPIVEGMESASAIIGIQAPISLRGKFELKKTDCGNTISNEMVFSVAGEKIWHSGKLSKAEILTLIDSKQIIDKDGCVKFDKDGHIKIDENVIRDVNQGRLLDGGDSKALEDIYTHLASKANHIFNKSERIGKLWRSLDFRLIKPLAKEVTELALKREASKWIEILQVCSDRIESDLDESPVLTKQLANYILAVKSICTQEVSDQILAELVKAAGEELPYLLIDYKITYELFPASIKVNIEEEPLIEEKGTISFNKNIKYPILEILNTEASFVKHMENLVNVIKNIIEKETNVDLKRVYLNMLSDLNPANCPEEQLFTRLELLTKNPFEKISAEDSRIIESVRAIDKVIHSSLFIERCSVMAVIAAHLNKVGTPRLTRARSSSNVKFNADNIYQYLQYEGTMHMPYQRIPRYHLLLKEVVSYSGGNLLELEQTLSSVKDYSGIANSLMPKDSSQSAPNFSKMYREFSVSLLSVN